MIIMADFVLVKCNCGYSQPIFKKAKSKVYCPSCSALLAEPTGGYAVIKGQIEKELE